MPLDHRADLRRLCGSSVPTRTWSHWVTSLGFQDEQSHAVIGDVPVGVGEGCAGAVTQRFVGPIIGGKAEQQLLLAALGGFGTMDAGHGFAVMNVGVALFEEPFDAGLRAYGAAEEGGCAGGAATVPTPCPERPPEFDARATPDTGFWTPYFPNAQV
ncbi:hypothetical protein OG257_09340 [Streptomyces sp. NBC_00683]|uniref:hypothetical protein n=1 Tax=Streptomyces sp. NBC_00683 TaxID=2903670 RepID=UPI002E30F685|nr:hypothetical protein [Streptomyces sp. NBC_00683]